MEFSRDQVFDFSGSGSIDVREAIDVGVRHGTRRLSARRPGLRNRRRLPDDKGEGEGELIAVGQLKDKAWRSCRTRCLRVLKTREVSGEPPLPRRQPGRTLQTHLKEFYGGIVAQGTRCRYSGSRK